MLTAPHRHALPATRDLHPVREAEALDLLAEAHVMVQGNARASRPGAPCAA